MARRSPGAARGPDADWVDVNLALLRARRPDLDLSGSAVTARLFRLREILVHELDRVHAQFGLRPRMFLVLAGIYRSGPPYSISPANLMRYLMWTSGGLAQLLDRMARSGLITRRADPGNRRGVLVTLTPKGRKVVDAVLEMHCEAELRLLGGLNRTEQRSLVGLLRKLLVLVDGRQRLPEDAAPRTKRRRS